MLSSTRTCRAGGVGAVGGTGSTAGGTTAADLSHRYLWGPAVDQVLADEQVTSLVTRTTVLPLTDNLGTVRDLARVYNAGTNATTVVNHRVFSAYGQILSQTNPATGAAATIGCLLGSDGCPVMNTPDGSQLVLHNARIIDVVMGQWMSQDPDNLTAGDTNLRRDCDNDPVNLTDPTGLRGPPTPNWTRLRPIR